jgi:hypothetical protein
MNLLVELLEANPSTIDAAAGADTVSFESLEELLVSSRATEPLVRERRHDPLLGERLPQSYVRVLSRLAWDKAIRAASMSASLRVAEWVTFVPSSDGEFGVTLPQDSLPVERLSLFDRLGDTVRRVSLVEMRGSPAAISLSHSVGHCSFPDRGTCDPGLCGSCTVRMSEANPPGLVCVCGH